MITTPQKKNLCFLQIRANIVPKIYDIYWIYFFENFCSDLAVRIVIVYSKEGAYT